MDANRETLAADKTITATDPFWQNLDTDGSNYNVDLPAEAKGLMFAIVNRDATQTLTVRDDSGVSTIITLAPGEGVFVGCDGTGWAPVGTVAGTPT